jgi:hypothetical protein
MLEHNEQLFEHTKIYFHLMSIMILIMASTVGGEPSSPSESYFKQPRKLGPQVCNANARCEGGTTIFYRKLEMPEVTRRRPGRASKEKASRGAKMENTSRRHHACHVLRAVACPHLIGGQQGGVVM